MNNRSEIGWAPRVSLAKIRELYLKEARGDCDDAMIDEVGFGLFARCAAILEFSAACAGSVRCKRCANSGVENLIAIDRLIHEFHWILIGEKDKPPSPHKPAGVNLLRGSTTQVLDALHELTYGENTPPGLLEGRDWWLAQIPVVKRAR